MYSGMEQENERTPQAWVRATALCCCPCLAKDKRGDSTGSDAVLSDFASIVISAITIVILVLTKWVMVSCWVLIYQVPMARHRNE